MVTEAIIAKYGEAMEKARKRAEQDRKNQEYKDAVKSPDFQFGAG